MRGAVGAHPGGGRDKERPTRGSRRIRPGLTRMRPGRAARRPRSRSPDEVDHCPLHSLGHDHRHDRDTPLLYVSSTWEWDMSFNLATILTETSLATPDADQMRKRAGDWGREGLDQRFAEAWQRFADAAEGWVDVVTHHGAGALRE